VIRFWSSVEDGVVAGWAVGFVVGAALAGAASSPSSAVGAWAQPTINTSVVTVAARAAAKLHALAPLPKTPLGDPRERACGNDRRLMSTVPPLRLNRRRSTRKQSRAVTTQA